MNSPAADIASILVSAGVGAMGNSGWAIKIGLEPTTPDTAITIYDTGGYPPNPKWLQDNPTVQARIRGSVGGYPAAYSKALAVRDALLGFAGQAINGTNYAGIWCMGDIVSLGYDDSNRPIFTVNFRMVREPSSGTYRA
jgi:hypothetical protein